MNKKIFLCGRVYDLNTLSELKIQEDIQKRIDIFYGGQNKGLATVKIENEQISIEVLRHFEDSVPSHISYGEDSIFCIDSDLLLGNGIEESVLVEKPQCVGFGYLYSWPVREFLDLYKKNCKLLGIPKPKTVNVYIDNKRLLFNIS